MAVKRAKWLGKAAYAALFNAVLPLLLWLWARGTRGVIHVPLPRARGLGALLAVVGLSTLLWATASLQRFGDGLPMNPYPPKRFVERGPYALVAHPIYLAAVLVCAGVSLFTESASGFWLVTPMFALACVALVGGYEAHDLNERFGANRRRAWLSWIVADDAAPTFFERANVFVTCVLGWIALYEISALSGTPAGAIALTLPGEASWPVLPATEIAYVSIYPAVALAPWLARSRWALRRFQLRALWSMLIVFPLFWCLPVVMPPRPFVSGSIWGELLGLERRFDTEANAFPSFHVVWACIVARSVAERWPRLRSFAWLWALTVAASCVATGMHSVLDVLAGLFVGLGVARIDDVWRLMQRGAERVASSWRDVRVGPVRFINHGCYAAFGAFGSVAIVQVLLGPSLRLEIVLAAGLGLVFAAAWAQVIEGSSQLMRPYGFYGGVLGICLGGAGMQLCGRDGFSLLAAYAVAGPFVQAWGRLRCLVQGCCHGAPTRPEIGIRYRHPMSRVCRLSPYRDVPLHATQLYSILWNIPVALGMARLWALHFPSSFIGGMYLALTGLGRFVEESYRGEPQTPVYAGLRLYQWVAIATLLTGAGLTTLSSPSWKAGPVFHCPGLALAAVTGLLVGVALGVDLPDSQRRFSRLA